MNTSMPPRQLRRMVDDDVAHRLRTVIGDRTLQVHYQPIVALPSCRTIGVEALVRWPERAGNRPQTITTDQLVEVAERDSLIRDLGAYVLARASTDRERLRLADGAQPYLSLNVSAAELTDDLMMHRVRAFADRGLDAAMLCLEITERVALSDLAQAARQLSALREMGCTITLDDFGTGYSSLGLLRDLPLDQVKIDRSFVERVDSSLTDAVLVRSIIESAHVLGLRVTAEGVTSPAQAQQLVAMGCDQAQGWLFGRPAPAEVLQLSGSASVAEQVSPLSTPPLHLGEREELVVITDASHVVRYASAGSIRLLGLSPAELSGRRLDDFVDDDASRIGEQTVEVRHTDGAPRFLRRRLQRLVSASDTDGMLWVAVDDTASEQARRALSQSQERFRAFFDTIGGGAAIVSPEGELLRVNRAFAGLLGYEPDDLAFRPYATLLDPIDRPRVVRAIEDLMACRRDGVTLGHPLRRRDGTTTTVTTRLTLTTDLAGQPSSLVLQVSSPD